jgi:hypothetical protein
MDGKVLGIKRRRRSSKDGKARIVCRGRRLLHIVEHVFDDGEAAASNAVNPRHVLARSSPRPWVRTYFETDSLNRVAPFVIARQY